MTNLLGETVKKILEGAALEWSFDIFAAPLKAVIQAITSGFSMQIYGYWLKYALRPVKAYNLSMKEQTRQILKTSSEDGDEE
jgi:hypothetical protein